MNRLSTRKIIIASILVLLFLVIAVKEAGFDSSAVFHNQTAVKHDIYYRDRAVVLIYHNFSERECGTAISPNRFAQHLDMLEHEGFNVVSLDDVVMFVQNKKVLPPNAVAITMDDGYESNYTVAYPLLQKKHWPAAVFVVVAKMGFNKSAGMGNKWLDWPNIKDLSQNDVMIGSHSYNGHRFITGKYPKGEAWFTTKLAGEDQTAYEKRIYDNLLLSRNILQQKLHTPMEHFAHPFGFYNHSVVEMAKKTGYKYLWTTKKEPVTANSSLDSLGRVSVGIGGTSPEDLKRIILEVSKKQPIIDKY